MKLKGNIAPINTCSNRLYLKYFVVYDSLLSIVVYVNSILIDKNVNGKNSKETFKENIKYSDLHLFCENFTFGIKLQNDEIGK